MFSFKSDPLFPSLAQAKELAHRFNYRPRHRPTDADPRELHRIAEELRKAREKAEARAFFHRHHWL
jgi:hypothetical protein